MRVKFYSLRDLEEILRIGPGAILGMAERGEFPAPFLLGRKRKRIWRVADVEAWAADLPDAKGKRVGERGRVPWDDQPDLPTGLLDVAGRVIEFPPCESAVYFLMRADRVMYVGQTTDLPGRISAHRLTARNNPDRHFDRVFYIPTPPFQLLLDEHRYIKDFSPPWNVMGNVARLD